MIHTQISNENHGESDQGKVRGATPLPPGAKTREEIKEIDEPRHQRADFLGVPTPKTAPCFPGPHRAETKADRERGKSPTDNFGDQAVELLQGGQAERQAGWMLRFELPLLQKIREAHGKSVG